MNFIIKIHILILGLFMLSCGTASESDSQPDVTENTSQVINNQKEKADAIPDDSDLKKVVLPGGKEVAFQEGGYCHQIVKELNADSPNFGKAFVLQDIVIDKGRLPGAGARELSSLVEILALAPHLSILVEGKDKALLEAIQSQLLAEGMEKARVDIRVSPDVGTPQILLKET